MNNNLYFIDLISNALQQSNPKSKLVEAFLEIIQMGQQSQYEQGLHQFHRFIAEVRKNWGTGLSKADSDIHEIIQDMCLEAAESTIENDMKKLLKSQNPILKLIYDIYYSESMKFKVFDEKIHVIIERDGKYFAATPIGTTSQMISGARPGLYVISTSTGRLLWQGELTKQDLFWEKAFPEQELQLAAETEEPPVVVTKEIPILDGKWVLRVIPQIESGCIEISKR
jgi:hypothetical protein